MQFCCGSVGDEAMKVERERERERGLDEEIEGRISSAMCQSAPVGVFICIKYL